MCSILNWKIQEGWRKNCSRHLFSGFRMFLARVRCTTVQYLLYCTFDLLTFPKGLEGHPGQDQLHGCRCKEQGQEHWRTSSGTVPLRSSHFLVSSRFSVEGFEGWLPSIVRSWGTSRRGLVCLMLNWKMPESLLRKCSRRWVSLFEDRWSRIQKLDAGFRN